MPVLSRSTPPRLTSSIDEGGLPLVDVAGAVTAAVRGLIPSCSCAVLVQVGSAWQIVAQSGAAEIGHYHWRHLAALDMARPGIVRTDRHLVAGVASRRLAACLLLVANPGCEVPERAAELLRSMLDCAAEKLDAAVVLQRRDRALRRLELLRLQGDGEHARSFDELRSLVASLWPRAIVNYLSRDLAMTMERPVRRLVREACATQATAVAAAPDGTYLLPAEWTHCVAVPVSKTEALLVEPAAAGEALDEESVAAASVFARLWTLVERHEAALADARRLRQEDRETGHGTAPVAA
jgi:hypothetical protein